jgi:hypothetical protein
MFLELGDSQEGGNDTFLDEWMANLKQTRLFWTLLLVASGATLGWVAAVSRWPIADNGHVALTDFATVWAAGVRALSGKAALAYDLELHEPFYASLINQAPANGLTFGYPPPALLLYAPFGLAPYGPSLLVYLLLGAGLWFWALHSIVKDTLTAAGMTLAWGGATHTIMLGQNGFLSASALAGGLLLLERRPKLAGIMFGLLAIKPHLGLAVAVFLLVRREWTAIAATVSTIAILIAATLVLWGPEVWRQYFAASQEITSIVAHRADSVIAHKMQSVFAAAVDHVSVTTALVIHTMVAFAALLMMIVTVLRRAEFPVQIASVIAASLLVTPYSFLYDATVLTAAAACLLAARPSERERWVLLGAMMLPGLWFFTAEPFVPVTCIFMLVLCLLQAYRISPNRPRSNAGAETCLSPARSL